MRSGRFSLLVAALPLGLAALAVLPLGGCRAPSHAAPVPAVEPDPIAASPAPAPAVAGSSTGSFLADLGDLHLPLPAAKKHPLELNLRSTPAGAQVAVDGQIVGATPVTYAIEGDGKQHEFSFLLSGYGIERYRFVPVQNGVVHATMHAVATPDDSAHR